MNPNFILFQTLRVQAPSGTKRLEIDQDATLRKLFDTIQEAYEMPSFDFSVYKERNFQDEVNPLLLVVVLDLS